MTDTSVHLRRSIGTTRLVLYGLGVTVGAGIYVLVGAAAGRAGMHVPLSFVLAAIVMAFTAASFAELSGRMPVSAGEAAYVQRGFGSAGLALTVGLMVVMVGSISAAAIANGAAGYIRVFVDLPAWVIVPITIIGLAMIAALGIETSTTAAGVMAVIEIGGLLFIVAASIVHDPALPARLPEILTGLDVAGAWSGILAASLLAFFAFVGFEDMVNVAEEVREPTRVMPRAIFLTLAISSAIYFMVVSVAILSVPIGELAASEAPLALVFQRTTGGSPLVIAAIAIVATLNGIIVQIIMASRVVYGLASLGQLPRGFAKLHPRTQTPIVATVAVTALIFALAMLLPLETLAEKTSQVTLVIFAIVDLALIRIKLSGEAVEPGVFTVPIWVPALGFLTCSGLLIASVFY